MTEVRSLFHKQSDGGFVIERVQDVEPIIERNKALQNAPQDKRSDLRHIASIPCVIIEKWCRDEGVNYLALDGREFGKMVSRKLKDPQWKWLRTGA